MKNKKWLIFTFVFLIFNISVGYSQIEIVKSYEQYCNEYEKKILKEFKNYAVTNLDLPSQLFQNASNEILIYQYDEESDKCSGKLIMNGTTYQVNGAYGISEGESLFFGVLSQDDKVQGIIRWYYYIEDNSTKSLDGVSINRIQNNQEYDSNLPLVSSSSCYDEYEIDMIGSANNYRVATEGSNPKSYASEETIFSFREYDNDIQGILTVKGVDCDVYGLYMSEGMYFASIWCKGVNRGVLYWDYSDSCITLTNKIDCKEYELDLCKTEPQQKQNPFGNGTSRQFGNDMGSGSGSGVGPSGAGSGTQRIRLTEPNTNHIITPTNQIIYLKLTIDENGTVMSGTSTSKTTTTDQKIISQVINEVKKVKYNKAPGAGIQTVYLTVRLSSR